MAELKTPEFYLEAIKQNVDAFQNAPKELITPEFCLKAVKIWGTALGYVPNDLKTPELCLEAVKNRGTALGYVLENLITPELCLEAIKQDVNAFQYVPDKLKAQVKAASPAKGTFTDSRDNNVYKTIRIGDQIWMAENLNFDSPKSKCYDNDLKNAEKYGRLYDWETAKKVCPEGWHLPSKEEWNYLVNSAHSIATAGKELKAKEGWNGNGNGTDNLYFSALPGGVGYSGGVFRYLGDRGNWWSAEGYSWWSANEEVYDFAYGRGMSYNSESVILNKSDSGILFSVRCVQD